MNISELLQNNTFSDSNMNYNDYKHHEDYQTDVRVFACCPDQRSFRSPDQRSRTFNTWRTEWSSRVPSVETGRGRSFRPLSNLHHVDKFQPLYLSNWNENTMEALLTIRCYICNKITNNSNSIIIRKTGKKLFRISTNCAECSKFKSKMFCDNFNKLPNDMYKLTSNKIYFDYTSTGIRFVDLV